MSGGHLADNPGWVVFWNIFLDKIPPGLFIDTDVISRGPSFLWLVIHIFFKSNPIFELSLELLSKFPK